MGFASKSLQEEDQVKPDHTKRDKARAGQTKRDKARLGGPGQEWEGKRGKERGERRGAGG